MSTVGAAQGCTLICFSSKMFMRFQNAMFDLLCVGETGSLFLSQLIYSRPAVNRRKGRSVTKDFSFDLGFGSDPGLPGSARIARNCFATCHPGFKHIVRGLMLRLI